MSEDFGAGFAQLASSGWTVTASAVPVVCPSTIVQRYRWVPRKFWTALAQVDCVCRRDEKVWLVTTRDYAGLGSSAFSWNECEKMSLSAAEGDGAWTKEIRSFWDRHLPIAYSVDGAYGYWALTEQGTVIRGREPDFEECSLFAETYLDFLSRIDSD